MKIIVPPKVLLFKRESGSLDYFARPEFYREEIPFGEQFLNLVHTERHIRKIKRACEIKAHLAELNLRPSYYEVACWSIGSVIHACQTGDFAIQGLTGHHAGKDTAKGFNLFNSTAIAAQKLVNEGKRVAIIDIDGHHGDGIQRIFYNNNQILYCSVHQEDAFPGTGKKEEIGRGEGRGYTFNIPIPPLSNDTALLSALERIILRTEKFSPDIVGVYAGFDGYYLDQLLDLKYSLEGFRKCGLLIGKSFNNVFGVLGGAYHSDLAKCMLAFVSGINGE